MLRIRPAYAHPVVREAADGGVYLADVHGTALVHVSGAQVSLSGRPAGTSTTPRGSARHALMSLLIICLYIDRSDWNSGRTTEVGVSKNGGGMDSTDRGYSSGRYQVIRHIGAGGMGQVFLAEDTLLDRHVALKVVAAHAMEDPEYGRRLAYEARVMARLHHPGIVTIFDAFTERDELCLVLEYVEGTNFRTFLRKGQFTPDFGRRMIRDVGAALSYLHDEHGVVHRDIKPENILVGRDGQIKLVDFGIARKASDERLTRTGMVIGTKSYIAPEVMAGATATSASDVWSFGMVMREAYDQLASELQAPLPSAVRLVLDGMLQTDLLQRPTPRALAAVSFDPVQSTGAAPAIDPTQQTAPRAPLPPTRTLPPRPAMAVTPLGKVPDLSWAERVKRSDATADKRYSPFDVHFWVRSNRDAGWRRFAIDEAFPPRLAIKSGSSNYHYLLWGDEGKERIWQVNPETATARKLPYQPVKQGVFSFTERYILTERDGWGGSRLYDWCDNEILAHTELKSRQERKVRDDVYRSGSYKRNGWGIDSYHRIQLWGYSELFGRELYRPVILKGLPEMDFAVIRGDKLVLRTKLGAVLIVLEGPGPQGSLGSGRDWHAVKVPFPAKVNDIALEDGLLLAAGQDGTIWGANLLQNEQGGNVTVLADNIAFDRFCPGGFITEDQKLRLLNPVRTAELPAGGIIRAVSDQLVIMRPYGDMP